MLLSSNLIYVLYNYIGVRKKFWKKRVTDRNDCFHWTLISPSSNLNCWAQLHELILDYQFARTHLKPQNFTWITILTLKFYKVMPIANIFSSYWSYIHGMVIYSYLKNEKSFPAEIKNILPCFISSFLGIKNRLVKM